MERAIAATSDMCSGCGKFWLATIKAGKISILAFASRPAHFIPISNRSTLRPIAVSRTTGGSQLKGITLAMWSSVYGAAGPQVVLYSDL